MKNSLLRPMLMLLALCLLAGCKLRRPDEVLSPKKMEAVLYDYHIAQSVALDLQSNERYKRDLLYNYVFDKHGVTQEQFDASLVWYTRNPKKFAEIYEKLSDRIDKAREAASVRMQQIEKKSYSVASGDSVELWYLRRAELMSATRAYADLITFEIPADTTFYKGDTLKWNLSLDFIGIAPDSVERLAYAYIIANYGDSLASVDLLAEDKRSEELMLVTDTVRSITKITGGIQYIDRSGSEKYGLLVNRMSLLRLHMHPDTASVAAGAQPVEISTAPAEL